MSDEEFDKFTTSLREVLLFIKYSADKDRLQALVSKDARFRSVEKSAVKVINTVTQSKLIFCNEEREVFDVCKAIDDIRTEARAEGRNEGRNEGMLEQARKTAYNLHDMGLPTDKIAGAVNVSIETVREWFVRRPGQITT